MSSYWVSGYFEPPLSLPALTEVEKLQPFVDYTTLDYEDGSIDDAHCTPHVFGFGWVSEEYAEEFVRRLDELLRKFEVAARLVMDAYRYGPEPARYVGHAAHRLEAEDLRGQILELQDRLGRLSNIAEAGAED